MTDKRRHDAQDGFILADAIYTLAAVRTRLGLGQAALRSARRNGLTVRQIGRCRFIIGKDLIAWLEKQET